jgi:hypothetical protein
MQDVNGNEMNYETIQVLLLIENTEPEYRAFNETLESIPDTTKGNEDAARIVKGFVEAGTSDESINFALVDWLSIVEYGRYQEKVEGGVFFLPEDLPAKPYKVVFVPNSDENRDFNTKQEAKNYKSEHPEGKFASVVNNNKTAR